MADFPFDSDDPESLRIGEETERRALAALTDTMTSPDKPFWLLGARKGSLRDDMDLKTDIWLNTPFGEIPLQIKSSPWGVRKFNKLYAAMFPKVIPVAILLNYTPSDIIDVIGLRLQQKDRRFRYPPPESRLDLEWNA